MKKEEYSNESNAPISMVLICLPMTFIPLLQSLHHLPHFMVPVRAHTEQRSEKGTVHEGDCQPNPES